MVPELITISVKADRYRYIVAIFRATVIMGKQTDTLSLCITHDRWLLELSQHARDGEDSLESKFFTVPARSKLCIRLPAGM